MRKKQKNVKLRNEKGKKNPNSKKSSQFLCHALFQAPHFISISLFKLSHLNSHTEPSPIALRFCDMYVCFFFRFYFFCCVISKAFSNFFSISIREKLFPILYFFPIISSRIFLFKCALCMYAVWLKWTNNFSLFLLMFIHVCLREIWDFFISLLFLLLFLHFDKSTLGK